MLVLCSNIPVYFLIFLLLGFHFYYLCVMRQLRSHSANFFIEFQNVFRHWFFFFPHLGGHLKNNIQGCWFLCNSVLFNLIIVLLLGFHPYWFYALRRFRGHSANLFNKIRNNLILWFSCPDLGGSFNRNI